MIKKILTRSCLLVVATMLLPGKTMSVYAFEKNGSDLNEWEYVPLEKESNNYNIEIEKIREKFDNRWSADEYKSYMSGGEFEKMYNEMCNGTLDNNDEGELMSVLMNSLIVNNTTVDESIYITDKGILNKTVDEPIYIADKERKIMISLAQDMINVSNRIKDLKMMKKEGWDIVEKSNDTPQ